MDVSEINRMRSFGEFLDNNYQSPNKQGIKKLLRIREIDDLGNTKSFSTKNLLKDKKLSNFINQQLILEGTEV